MVASEWIRQPGNILYWSIGTIACYAASKWIYRRKPAWWTSPIALTPVLIVAAAELLHVSYREYIDSTRWLVTLLGPCIVAFAVPIYEQRAVLRKYWDVLLIGATVGSATSIGSVLALSKLMGLTSNERLSLLPRSISTPFAMDISRHLGGTPELTAVFVILTGVLGASIGQILLSRLPVRSSIAAGAMFGVGAHGIGAAKAHEIGREEGSIAGLLMVVMGLLNVLAAPILAHFI